MKIDDYDSRLIARLALDLSSIAANQTEMLMQVPGDAHGVSFVWMSDNNSTKTGSIVLYLGDVTGFPWGVMAAPATAMSIARGPISRVTERGAYFTIKLSAGAQGILLAEFLTTPSDRIYSSS